MQLVNGHFHIKLFPKIGKHDRTFSISISKCIVLSCFPIFGNSLDFKRRTLSKSSLNETWVSSTCRSVKCSFDDIVVYFDGTYLNICSTFFQFKHTRKICYQNQPWANRCPEKQYFSCLWVEICSKPINKFLINDWIFSKIGHVFLETKKQAK